MFSLTEGSTAWYFIGKLRTVAAKEKELRTYLMNNENTE